MTAQAILDLDVADRPAMIQLWTEIIGSRPPPRLSRGMMVRILACELQWEGSSQSRARLIKRLNQVAATGERSRPIAKPGARLVREWNGREHVVDVTRDGYLWNGAVWRSLSAIAREITGTKWSGPRFFGVAA